MMITSTVSANGVRRFLYCAMFGVLAISQPGFAQTLNDATTAELGVGVVNGVFTPCAQLLNGDATTVLGSGGLRSICDRGLNQAGVPPSSSGGGFAGTAPSMPSAVEARLEEEDEDAEGRRGFFFSAGYDGVDRVRSTFEDGYDSDIVRFAGGFDFAVGTAWVLGFAVDGSNQEGDFIDGGNFEIRTLGITGFGSYDIGENASFDAYAGYSSLANDRLRRATFTEVEDPNNPFTVVGAPLADYDADQLLFGLKFSYDWVWDNVTLGPRFGYDWNRTDYDTYSETDSPNTDQGLTLTFHDDEETSSQFSVGLSGSVTVSTKFGSVLLEQDIAYRHETDQDQRLVQVSFVEDTRAKRFTYQTENPDRDFLQYSLGATFILQNGLQLLFEYGGISSHRFLDTNTIAAGFRKEF